MKTGATDNPTMTMTMTMTMTTTTTANSRSCLMRLILPRK
jgi:hypothetical protein